MIIDEDKKPQASTASIGSTIPQVSIPSLKKRHVLSLRNCVICIVIGIIVLTVVGLALWYNAAHQPHKTASVQPPSKKVAISPPSVVQPTPAPIPTPTTTDTSYDKGVLVIKYFPLTSDGQNIDSNITGDVSNSYASVRQHTIDITNNLITALGEATRYLGYKDPSAKSALTYRVVDTKEYTQPVPIKPKPDAPSYPDYNLILSQQNICDYVNNKGVSEVWLWAYQGPNKPGTNYPYLGISESKMSGPHGDISNSPRYNDMPLCNHTYDVYTFNYGRGSGEAIHSWGHQIEAELRAVDSTLFRLFQGPNYPQTLGITGRCGSVHNPPNARNEYDWANTIPQQSDCMDWQPDGLGALSSISCVNWGCQDISDTDNPQFNWMIWMWQNLPGINNTKTYHGQRLRNWWDVHGDFDAVMGGNNNSLLLP